MSHTWQPPWPRQKVGVVNVVPWRRKLVALQDNKGRGVILPGGKLQAGESFHAAAARELFEETGLTATRQELMFGGADCDGIYVYAFITDVAEGKLPSQPGAEGAVVLATWDMLDASYYHGYYRILREILSGWPGHRERLDFPSAG